MGPGWVSRRTPGCSWGRSQAGVRGCAGASSEHQRFSAVQRRAEVLAEIAVPGTG